MISEANSLIKKYGQTVSIKKTALSDPEITKAFIQPLRSDYQSNLYGDYIETEGVEQFLYIGLPNHNLPDYPNTTRITFSNQTYTIKKAENVYFGENVLYVRAVLEKDS
ncbi:MAG: hypothetical protein IJJ04_00855 [Clostridia bacterium]|nr:hypothetical protein [Clostridia bacterium]